MNEYMGLLIVFHVCYTKCRERIKYEKERGEMQVDFIWGVGMMEIG